MIDVIVTTTSSDNSPLNLNMSRASKPPHNVLYILCFTNPCVRRYGLPHPLLLKVPESSSAVERANLLLGHHYVDRPFMNKVYAILDVVASDNRRVFFEVQQIELRANSSVETMFQVSEQVHLPERALEHRKTEFDAQRRVKHFRERVKVSPFGLLEHVLVVADGFLDQILVHGFVLDELQKHADLLLEFVYGRRSANLHLDENE